MINKSKQKGKRFEEKVSGIIRKKWNLSKNEVHRALTSGIYQSEYSDIYIVPLEYKIPHILFECKYGKSYINTINDFVNINKFLKVVYKQIDNSAKKYFKEYNIIPLRLIIFSRQRLDVFCCLDDVDLYNINNNSHSFNIKSSLDINKLDFYMKIKSYHIFMFDELLNYIFLLKKV